LPIKFIVVVFYLWSSAAKEKKTTIQESDQQVMNKLILPILILLAFVSCSGDSNEPDVPDTGRTLLVWLAGDNNLASEVQRKIDALAEGFAAADHPGSRMLIYADRSGNYPQLMEVSSQGKLKILATYPAQNSASPETLHRLLTEMMSQAPAEHYGLIIFSHATGWLPKGALEHPTNYRQLYPQTGDETKSRTILDDNGVQMPFADFAEALPLPPSGKYDYIVFENCFTAGIEVAYDLRDKTRQLLVSSAEILSPGFEDIYPQALDLLLKPAADICGFARSYYDFRNSRIGNYRSATVSVLNTEAITQLAMLVRTIETSTPSLDEALLPQMQRFNRHRYTLFFDLEEYLTMRCPERADEIHAAIGDIVEYSAATPSFIKGYTNGFDINRHCGITTYIPQSGFPDLNEDYARTAWLQACISL